MPILVPSILETSKQGFLDKYNREVKLPGVERLQVDFGDGKFIDTELLPVSEIDVLNPAFHWEAHLMCQAPQDFLDYQICGFKTIIIHYEAYKNKHDLTAALREIRKLGMKAGLVINPDTKVEAFLELKDLTDQFCIMSVVPGKQGQSFIESSLQKVKELRQMLPNAIIEIDGGVNETNIKTIAQSGADFIILGSAITKAQNMAEAWEKLKVEAI